MKKKGIAFVLALLTLQMGACGNEKVVQLQPKVAEKEIAGEETKVEEMYKNDGNDGITIQLNAFGWDLLKESMQEKNPVLSPLSAYLALNMVAEGANGNTKAEFEKVLGSLEQQEVVSELARKELVKNTDGMVFKINDSIWVDDMFETKQDWVDKVMSIEGNKAFSVKLEDPVVVGLMNQWIDDSTNGLIKEMIKEPFTVDDRMVLFDAIYMKGKWSSSFDPFGTYEEEFTLENQEKIIVPTMHMNGERFDYFSNDSVEGVVMPYQDSSLAYVAVKSKNGKNIRAVIENMKLEDIWSLLKAREAKKLNLRLPKYDITAEQDLKQILEGLGIVDAFSGENADFYGMGISKDGNNVCVSQVKQKARIKVDEEGTEAAAVTEVLMGCESCMIEEEIPYELFFQEPFYYMIVDMDNRIPVFMGVLNDPMEN